jgi:hypothetical protein
MPADKPLIRLTADQLDRLLILQQRQLQLTEKRLLDLGVTPAQIDHTASRAATVIPLASGGTIELEGEHYRLVDHDETSVTLRRV